MAIRKFPETSFSKSVGQFVFPLFVALCVCLDVLSLIVLPLLPETINALACELWPIVGLLKPLLSHSVASFVTGQCTIGQPIEPAVSIVFFVTKIFLAIALGLFVSCLAIAFPSEIAYRRFGVDVRQPGGVGRWARSWLMFAGGMGGLAFLGLAQAGVFTTPDAFNTQVFHKLFEDVTAAILYLAIGFPLMSIGSVVRFAFSDDDPEIEY